MARTVGQKLSHFLDEIYPILANYASSLKEDTSVDIDNEIAEACLNTLESLLKRCPKEITPYVPRTLGMAVKLLSYDPNFTYMEEADEPMGADDDGEGWGDEFEDDQDAGADDDDTSWKVRRAAVRVIEAIIVSRPEMLREIYQS